MLNEEKIKESVEKYGYVEEIVLDKNPRNPDDVEEEYKKIYNDLPELGQYESYCMRNVDLDTELPGDVKDIVKKNRNWLKPYQENTGFKIQCNFLFLTYSRCEFNIHKHKKFIQGVVGKTGTWKVAAYLCAKEKHKDPAVGVSSCEYHMHCMIRIVNNFNPNGRYQTTNPRIFDFCTVKGDESSKIHPNIQQIKNGIKGWAAVADYINKDNRKKECDDDSKDKHLNATAMALERISHIYSCETLAEAIGMYPLDRPMDVKCIWDARPKTEKRKYIPKCPDFEWCKKMLDYIKSPWSENDRTVHWVYDIVGGSGKSFFTRYCRYNKLALTMSSTGRSADFAMNVQNASATSGWNGECFIMDLARQNDSAHRGERNSSDPLYKCLEDMKDGFLTCTKYGGGFEDWFPGCKIIVTANWVPAVTAMTFSRWRIWRMTADKDIDLMDLEEVFDILKSPEKQMCNDEEIDESDVTGVY